jgi:hypothetical protein
MFTGQLFSGPGAGLMTPAYVGPANPMAASSTISGGLNISQSGSKGSAGVALVVLGGLVIAYIATRRIQGTR